MHALHVRPHVLVLVLVLGLVLVLMPAPEHVLVLVVAIVDCGLLVAPSTCLVRAFGFRGFENSLANTSYLTKQIPSCYLAVFASLPTGTLRKLQI